ncbi:hypothetical protein SAMN05216316_0981 [Nitrosovibrio sp. Nv6]|nr:hypothetical protein SAMN05216316_0981 [Nitrosovibrio sp. Nv6]
MNPAPCCASIHPDLLPDAEIRRDGLRPDTRLELG